MQLAPLTSGGVLTSMDDAGYLDESGLNIDPKMVEWVDERGFVINSLSGGEIWKWTSKLQQSSLAMINLIRSYTSYFHMYYKSAALPNGNVQEIYIPLVKIVNALTLSFKAGEKRLIELELTSLMPKGAVTVTPAGLSVPDSSYGIIVENAVALGPVTTANGTIYTAAV